MVFLGALLTAPPSAMARPETPRVSLWRHLVILVRRLVLHPPVGRQRRPGDWVRLVAWEGLWHTAATGLGVHRVFVRQVALELAAATDTRSIGRPHCGYLARPVELPDDEAYHRRHPELMFGTKATVAHTRGAIASVTAKLPHVHPLSIGDLSAERGGSLMAHRSHQSGRDVDIGLYYLEPPAGYPDRFVPATVENLDREATWTLLTALARTARRPGGVDYILLDHDVQGLVFAWARDHGVSKRTIRRILQYPRPPEIQAGLVRHFPKHDDHLHVRFRCPPRDRWCVD